MWVRAGILKVVALAAVLATATVGCESKALRAIDGAGGVAGHPAGRDAGAGGASKLGGDASVDRPNDETPAPLGASCAGSGGCLSGFCVEGVCCTSACTGGCQTCSAPGAVGTCLQRTLGAVPRQATDCPRSAPSTCGFDGTCDGAGACRLYLGNTCVAGACANGAVTGAAVCDGQGNCLPGPTFICAPYGCDSATGQCETSCTSDEECLGGQRCQGGVCGAPPRGSCSTNGQCVSGFCADGVCCDTACAGPCVSCAQPGRVGTCSPAQTGAPDPARPLRRPGGIELRR